MSEGLLPSSGDTRRKKFGEIIGGTALCFPSAVHLDAAAIQSYYIVLGAVPLTILAEAAKRIMQTPGTEHFPAAPFWLEMCNTIARETHEQLRATAKQLVTRDEPYYCPTCKDVGWEPVERDGRHMVRPCGCREKNPVYISGRGAPVYRPLRRRTDEQKQIEQDRADARRQLADLRSRAAAGESHDDAD